MPENGSRGNFSDTFACVCTQFPTFETQINHQNILSEDSHVILNLRVVSARSTANPTVTKVKIKTDPSTKVVTLRKALAKEARRPLEFLKLTYSNQTLLDGQTLAQHGMTGSVNVEVILFDNHEVHSIFTFF